MKKDSRQRKNISLSAYVIEKLRKAAYVERVPASRIIERSLYRELKLEKPKINGK